MSMRSRCIPSALAVVCLVASVVACESEPKPVAVTYYYTAGCAACEDLKPTVAVLETEFPGRVEVEYVEASTPESQEDIKRLEFREDGLVVRDPRGAVLVKQADHAVNLEEVRTALRTYFETQSGG